MWCLTDAECPISLLNAQACPGTVDSFPGPTNLGGVIGEAAPKGVIFVEGGHKCLTEATDGRADFLVDHALTDFPNHQVLAQDLADLALKGGKPVCATAHPLVLLGDLVIEENGKCGDCDAVTDDVQRKSIGAAIAPLVGDHPHGEPEVGLPLILSNGSGPPKQLLAHVRPRNERRDLHLADQLPLLCRISRAKNLPVHRRSPHLSLAPLLPEHLSGCLAAHRNG
mmetsp:Transcript_14188/g.42838  ORF Transcript_14188/g.42838 Transcript_14188/m.42838 type:complete len:225 (+) Transcript_14188:1394-2068(+)